MKPNTLIELQAICVAPTIAGHTPYAHVNFEVNPTPEAKHWSDDPIRGYYIKDLQIHCQIDDRDFNPAQEPAGPSYAWEVRYERPYAVGLTDAQKMHQTLKLVDQRLAKLRQQFGYSRTYGSYVAHVAALLQPAVVVFYETYPNGRRFEKCRCSPGEAIPRIDELVLEHWRACRRLAGKSDSFTVPPAEVLALGRAPEAVEEAVAV